jgi:hypothetical protein
MGVERFEPVVHRTDPQKMMLMGSSSNSFQKPENQWVDRVDPSIRRLDLVMREHLGGEDVERARCRG